MHGSGVGWSPTSKQDNGMESSITLSCEKSGADSGYSGVWDLCKWAAQSAN